MHIATTSLPTVGAFTTAPAAGQPDPNDASVTPLRTLTQPSTSRQTPGMPQRGGHGDAQAVDAHLEANPASVASTVRKPAPNTPRLKSSHKTKNKNVHAAKAADLEEHVAVDVTAAPIDDDMDAERADEGDPTTDQEPSLATTPANISASVAPKTYARNRTVAFKRSGITQLRESEKVTLQHEQKKARVSDVEESSPSKAVRRVKWTRELKDACNKVYQAVHVQKKCRMKPGGTMIDWDQVMNLKLVKQKMPDIPLKSLKEKLNRMRKELEDTGKCDDVDVELDQQGEAGSGGAETDGDDEHDEEDGDKDGDKDGEGGDDSN